MSVFSLTSTCKSAVLRLLYFTVQMIKRERERNICLHKCPYVYCLCAWFLQRQRSLDPLEPATMRVQRLESKNLSVPLPCLVGCRYCPAWAACLQMGSQGCSPYTGGRVLEHLAWAGSSDPASLSPHLPRQAMSQSPGRPCGV